MRSTDFLKSAPCICLATSGWAGRSRLSEFRADDDGRADFVLRLIERLRHEGVRVLVDPSEIAPGASPDFELHIESQRSRFPTAPQFLLLIEDKHIRPQNYFVRWRSYRRVFSWDDDIVEKQGAFKYKFPAHIQPGPVGDWNSRPIFMSMVAANKAQAVTTPDDLYKERIRTLQWYQQHAPNDLQLYGPGWNMPFHPPGLLAKFGFKLLKGSGLFKARTRRCWKGIAPVKRDILLRSRFNLCYENTCGSRGYMSEKLFDALSTGAVPIYWGAPNVLDYVPAQCFIDRRNFASNAELHEFLRAVTPAQHSAYQQEMHDFCLKAGAVFGIDAFVDLVSSSILDEVRCTQR
jgi:hypothetical protein